MPIRDEYSIPLSVLSSAIEKKSNENDKTIQNICEAVNCNEEATNQVIVSIGKLGIVDLNLCNNCILKFDAY